MKRFFTPTTAILLAIFLGILSGMSGFAPLLSLAETVSDLFLNALKMLSLPIVFFAITSTITGMGCLKETALLGKKVAFYAVLTTVLAASVGLALYLVLDPARETLLAAGEMGATPAFTGSYLSFLIKAIPSNIIEAFAEGNVLGVAFLATFSSIATLMLPEEQRQGLHKFFSNTFSLILKMTHLIIWVMPVGVWAFVALFVVELQTQGSLANSLIFYVLAVLGANVLQGVIVLPLLAKSRGLSPWRLFRGMLPALTIGFFSKSSNAALPTALRCAQEDLGISKRVSNFSFPLGSIINMNGCAAFILITVLFVSTSEGWSFAWWELLSWVGISTLAAIGNASVPMGCYFLASAILAGMGVPLTLMGVILPIYTLIDMVETALNVWSNSCVTALVEQEIHPAPSDDALTVCKSR